MPPQPPKIPTQLVVLDFLLPKTGKVKGPSFVRVRMLLSPAKSPEEMTEYFSAYVHALHGELRGQLEQIPWCRAITKL